MKLPIVEDYVDEIYGMLHATPKQLSENGILFTAYHFFLGGGRMSCAHFCKLLYDHLNLKHACKFSQSPWSPDDPASHDNITALMALAYYFNAPIQLPILGVHWRPVDIIYYSRIKYPDHLLPKLFTPIASLWMIYSCWKTYQIRPYPWDKLKLYYLKWTKQIEYHRTENGGDRIIYKYKSPPNPNDPYVYWLDRRRATSGKLLSWLRFQSGLFPLTQKICNRLIAKQYSNWRTVFWEYFNDASHPVVVEAYRLRI